MFDHDHFIPLFISGTVYQDISSSLDSYRWLSPVNGVVRIKSPPPGYLYTTVAARALLFHDVDNPVVDLKGFVAVGLGILSSVLRRH